MYSKHFKFSLLIILFMIQGIAFAQKAISDLRVWGSPDNTRVVFDLTESTDYKIFTLQNPDRVVIDINNAQFKAKINQNILSDTGIKHIRHSQNEPGKLRIVLETQTKSALSHFLLDPSDDYGYRLVIDLGLNKKSEKKPEPKAKVGLKKRKFIVALDPGHGGEDSGAVGRYKRLKEKEVVLQVAKKLETMINAEPGMKAFLVRKGDYYVPLRKRMVIAREQNADLFVSIHADSFMEEKATGASVFVLSEKGASNEAARWLAEKENRADLIGGVKLEDKSDVLASVLLDLSQTACQSASKQFAGHLVSNISKIAKMHHKSVQRAGFMVLKSPDIPSVLVELGFISNREGEAKLGDPKHQHILATALLSGIKTYASHQKNPST